MSEGMRTHPELMKIKHTLWATSRERTGLPDKTNTSLFGPPWTPSVASIGMAEGSEQCGTLLSWIFFRFSCNNRSDFKAIEWIWCVNRQTHSADRGSVRFSDVVAILSQIFSLRTHRDVFWSQQENSRTLTWEMLGWSSWRSPRNRQLQISSYQFILKLQIYCTVPLSLQSLTCQISCCFFLPSHWSVNRHTVFRKSEEQSEVLFTEEFRNKTLARFFWLWIHLDSWHTLMSSLFVLCLGDHSDTIAWSVFSLNLCLHCVSVYWHIKFDVSTRHLFSRASRPRNRIWHRCWSSQLLRHLSGHKHFGASVCAVGFRHRRGLCPCSGAWTRSCGHSCGVVLKIASAAQGCSCPGLLWESVSRDLQWTAAQKCNTHQQSEEASNSQEENTKKASRDPEREVMWCCWRKNVGLNSEHRAARPKTSITSFASFVDENKT